MYSEGTCGRKIIDVLELNRSDRNPELCEKLLNSFQYSGNTSIGVPIISINKTKQGYSSTVMHTALMTTQSYVQYKDNEDGLLIIDGVEHKTEQWKLSLIRHVGLSSCSYSKDVSDVCIEYARKIVENIDNYHWEVDDSIFNNKAQVILSHELIDEIDTIVSKHHKDENTMASFIKEYSK